MPIGRFPPIPAKEFANLGRGGQNWLWQQDVKTNAWTPTIRFGQGTTGQTYLRQVGYWFRVGRIIHASWDVQFTAKGSSTGDADIIDLPFIPGGQGDLLYSYSIFWQNMASSLIAVTAEVTGGSTIITIRGLTAAATSSNTALNDTNFGNSSRLYGTVIYTI